MPEEGAIRAEREDGTWVEYRRGRWGAYDPTENPALLPLEVSDEEDSRPDEEPESWPEEEDEEEEVATATPGVFNLRGTISNGTVTWNAVHNDGEEVPYDAPPSLSQRIQQVGREMRSATADGGLVEPTNVGYSLPQSSNTSAMRARVDNFASHLDEEVSLPDSPTFGRYVAHFSDPTPEPTLPPPIEHAPHAHQLELTSNEGSTLYLHYGVGVPHGVQRYVEFDAVEDPEQLRYLIALKAHEIVSLHDAWHAREATLSIACQTIVRNLNQKLWSLEPGDLEEWGSILLNELGGDS